jgi:hypothetical protein
MSINPTFYVYEGKYEPQLTTGGMLPRYKVERTGLKFIYRSVYNGVTIEWQHPLWVATNDIFGKREDTGAVVVKLDGGERTWWNRGTIEVDVSTIVSSGVEEAEGYLVFLALTLLDVWQRQQVAH